MPKHVMSKLEYLFNLVLDKTYKTRKAKMPAFDGQAFWQPIKKALEPLDGVIKTVSWKPISKVKAKKIMSLPEYTIDGYENKVMNELNHFMIQQVRIPLTESPTIRKIIQIALNIGQYKASSNGKYLYKRIDQFISKADIVRLSEFIPDKIVEEIEKYLK